MVGDGGGEQADLLLVHQVAVNVRNQVLDVAGGKAVDGVEQGVGWGLKNRCLIFVEIFGCISKLLAFFVMKDISRPPFKFIAEYNFKLSKL